MRSATAMILLSAGAIGFLSGFALRGQTEEVSQGVRPKVTRTQSDGGVYYEPVLLKTYDFQFFERKKEIHVTSQLLDYDLDRDNAGHLSGLKFFVRSEPVKWGPAPPGGQADSLPLTRWTVYEDLDGDSILDVMTKVGPELHETYILVGHHWVRAGNRKSNWGKTPVTRGFESQDTYRFGPEGWKRD